MHLKAGMTILDFKMNTIMGMKGGLESRPSASNNEPERKTMVGCFQIKSQVKTYHIVKLGDGIPDPIRDSIK